MSEPSAAPAPRHVPVLLERCLELLAPSVSAPGAVVVDATLGLGGHSEAMLERFTQTTVIGIDRDPHALALATDRLARFGSRFQAHHAVYDEIAEVLAASGRRLAQGVLFDLGVSSMQLDQRERGFAYADDAPLDMRMNGATGITAAEVLNTYAVADLARILRDYGEEKFARQIARAVERARDQEPFASSGRLVELLYDTIPAPARRTGGHPAKRTFQALRIEVNDELGALRRAIPASLDHLDTGGRVVVMSYQSLEDRIVKRQFAERTASRVPHDLPVVPEGFEPEFRSITRGAEKASDEEIAQNSRAASVRLRAVERVRRSSTTTPPGRVVAA
ncbi:MAG: 16S rRNA (cytosine(1402)-N(4))-methyltransferase RsmH [Marmoricola sp.]